MAASGLKIQEMQYGFGSFYNMTPHFNIENTCRLSLQALVRKVGSCPTPDQKRDIALQRSWLQDKIDTFQRQAASTLHTVSNDADDSWGNENARETYTGAEFDGVGEEDDDDEPNSASEEHYQTRFLRDNPPSARINAEHISLHLLSHLGHSWYSRNAAKDLVSVELCLWEGQLNNSLHHICIALGHKSYLFRNNMHPACTQRLKTCAWAEVHAIKSMVQHHARVYNHMWQSMLSLGANTSLLDKYKVLEHQDLRIDTTIIAPNVHGQWNKSLPWFWSKDIWKDADIGA